MLTQALKDAMRGPGLCRFDVCGLADAGGLGPRCRRLVNAGICLVCEAMAGLNIPTTVCKSCGKGTDTNND